MIKTLSRFKLSPNPRLIDMGTDGRRRSVRVPVWAQVWLREPGLSARQAVTAHACCLRVSMISACRTCTCRRARPLFKCLCERRWEILSVRGSGYWNNGAARPALFPHRCRCFLEAVPSSSHKHTQTHTPPVSFSFFFGLFVLNHAYRIQRGNSMQLREGR